MRDFEEILVPISGYEGIYEISNTGRVLSCRGQIKGCVNKGGYLQLCLYKKPNRTTELISRLVAKHFIPNPHNLPEVNHKDGNKINNYVNNLEWVSEKQNIRHAFQIGLIKPRKRGRHPLAKLVIDLSTGIYYDCIKDAADSRNMNYKQLFNQMNPKHRCINKTSFNYA